MSVMEDGVDTKNIVEKYYELKKDQLIQKKTTDETIKNLKVQNKKITKQITAMMEHLKKQQEEVVRPMID